MMQRGWWGREAKLPGTPQLCLPMPNRPLARLLPGSQLHQDRMGRLLACPCGHPAWTRGQGAWARAAALLGLRWALGARDRKAPQGPPRPTAPLPWTISVQRKGNWVSVSWSAGEGGRPCVLGWGSALTW